MKNKVIAVAALLLALLMLFAACAKTPPQTDDSTDSTAADDVSTAEPAVTDDAALIDQIYPEGSRLPYVYLAAGKTDLNRGDVFEVQVRIADAENLGAYQLLLTFDETAFAFDSYKQGSVSDLIISSDQLGNQVQTYGITATTVDITDETVLTVTLKVLDTAAAGEALVTADVSQFIVGTDDSGDITADLISVKEMDAEISFNINA